MEEKTTDEKNFKLISLVLGIKSLAGNLAEGFVSLYASQLGITKSVIGLMVGIREVFALSFQFIWAEVSDKIGKRKIFIQLGMLISAFIWIMMALVKDTTWFVFLAGIQGIFIAMAGPMTTAILTQITTIQTRPRFMAKIFSTIGIFSLIGISVSTILLIFSPIPVLWCLAAVALAVAYVIIGRFTEPSFKADGNIQFIKSLKTVVFDYVNKRELRRFIIPVTLLYLSSYLVGGFLSIFIVQDLGASKSFYAVCIFAYTIFWMLTQKMWSRISEVHGRKSVIINSVYLCSLSLIVMAFSKDKWWMFFGYIINGIAWGGLNNGLDTLLMDLVPEANRAQYIAFVNVLIGSVALLAPIIGGLIAQYSSIRIIIIIALIVRAITIPFFFRVEEKQKRRFYPLSREIHKTIHYALKITHNIFHKH